MPWPTIAALTMAVLSLAGFVNERRQRKLNRQKGLDEVVNQRLTLLLTGGPAAVAAEYDAQGQIVLNHLREVIEQRDGLAVDVEELRGEVARVKTAAEREARLNREEITRLRERIVELERMNGHV